MATTTKQEYTFGDTAAKLWFLGVNVCALLFLAGIFLALSKQTSLVFGIGIFGLLFVLSSTTAYHISHVGMVSKAVALLLYIVYIASGILFHLVRDPQLNMILFMVFVVGSFVSLFYGGWVGFRYAYPIIFAKASEMGRKRRARK